MEELLSATNTTPRTVLTQVFQLDRCFYSILVTEKELSKNFPFYLSENGGGGVKWIFKEGRKQTTGLSLETSSCKFECSHSTG